MAALIGGYIAQNWLKKIIAISPPNREYKTNMLFLCYNEKEYSLFLLC